MTDAHFARLMHHVRERCAFIPRTRIPDREAEGELWSWYHREAVGLTPQQREELERAIRRGTGT